MIRRLAPRVRVLTEIRALRCAKRHAIYTRSTVPSVLARWHERAFFYRCDFTHGSGSRCGSWCYLEPSGVTGVRVTDMLAEQVARYRHRVFDPEWIAERVASEYRRSLLRRRA